MKNFVLTALLAGSGLAWSADVTDKDINDRLSQIEAEADTLETFAASTTRNKDGVPVTFNGDFYLRTKNHRFTGDIPRTFQYDKARTLVDGAMGISLGVYPNSNVNLWTVMYFPYDLSGMFGNNTAFNPNGEYVLNSWERSNERHSSDYNGVGLWEEMTAGIDMRTSYFAAMLKAGGVLWASGSPLTMWDRDPAPRFPSVFETFEEERTVSRYYKEKTFRPVKEGGRAFWTNRSFGGVMLDAYRLPANMSGHLLLSQAKDIDINTRDGLRLYAGQPGDGEMNGTLDFRSHVFSSRLAMSELGGSDFQAGVNWMHANYDKGILNEEAFLAGFPGAKSETGAAPGFNNNRLISLDFNGTIMPKLIVQAEIATSWDEQVTFQKKKVEDAITYDERKYKTDQSDFQMGFYTKIQSKQWIPISVEGVFFDKDWFSPFGISDDSRNRSWRKDQIHLNSGYNRYSPNLMGANIKIEPEFNRGRFDFGYGQHRQVDPGKDVIVFEHRLNGRSEWESMHSWSKFNSALAIDSGAAYAQNQLYDRRVSLEDASSKIKLDRQAGGLVGGTWEVWEEFTAWNSAEDIGDKNKVPTHDKWSSIINLDMAYDIGHWINYSRPVQLAANMALSGISTSFTPVPFAADQSDMLLWSYFVQSEPAIAITDEFHILGIFGYETWQAEKAYVKSIAPDGLTPVYDHSPIDFYQTALGCGFDWDFTQRAGLHVRYKYATHTDKNHSANDWTGHFITAETKAWF
jgi:hypothetical protein